MGNCLAIIEDFLSGRLLYLPLAFWPVFVMCVPCYCAYCVRHIGGVTIRCHVFGVDCQAAESELGCDSTIPSFPWLGPRLSIYGTLIPVSKLYSCLEVAILGWWRQYMMWKIGTGSETSYINIETRTQSSLKLSVYNGKAQSSVIYITRRRC